MHDLPAPLSAAAQEAETVVRLSAGTGSLGEHDRARIVSTADALRRAGYARHAIELMEPVWRLSLRDAHFLFVLALSRRAVDDVSGAYKAVTKAAALLPEDANIAFAKAQFAFESWQPAARHFRAARKLAPENLEIRRNFALALAAEGKCEAAISELEAALQEYPDWLEGYRQLVSLRTVQGDDAPDAPFVNGTERRPNDRNLWLAWVQTLGQRHEWTSARQVLEQAKARFPGDPDVLKTDLYVRCESGTDVDEFILHGELANAKDPGFDLCRIRYCLRRGQADRAEAITSKYLTSEHQRLFWPYASLCWRLLSDERAEWLEQNGAFIKEISLGLGHAELSRLARILRGIHRLQQPYPEQSVRGGIQTDRNLFFHPDPQIQALRHKLENVIADYTAAMPVGDEAHPLLGIRPDRIRFSGSWSVLLRNQGFHTTHTHVLGWLSSALYVEVPDEDAIGPPPAGYLSLGEAPPELGLKLAPWRRVAPKPGNLVLFPSYTWHGTVPFDKGERMTVAFDVIPG